MTKALYLFKDSDLCIYSVNKVAIYILETREISRFSEYLILVRSSKLLKLIFLLLAV